MRVLHVADVHLGAPLRSFEEAAEARRREIADAFRQLPAHAERLQARAVLLAGDLFDRPRPEPEYVNAARETIRRLTEAGRPCFLIPGNHDPLYRNEALYKDDLGGAHVFRTACFGDPVAEETPDGTLVVYGLAYDWAKAPHPLSTFRRADIDGVHIVLLHGSVPGAHYPNDGAGLLLPAEQLRALNVDYVALGDHHRFRPPARFDGGSVAACYPGSFAALDLTETGERGFVVADLHSGVPPSVELFPSGVRPLENLDAIDIGACSDDAAIRRLLADRTSPAAIPVLRLVGAPPFAPDLDAIRTELVQRCGHAWLTDDTHFYDSATFRSLAQRPDIAGHVAHLGLQRIARASGEEGRQLDARGLRIALRALEVEQ